MTTYRIGQFKPEDAEGIKGLVADVTEADDDEGETTTTYKAARVLGAEAGPTLSLIITVETEPGVSRVEIRNVFMTDIREIANARADDLTPNFLA